MRLATLSRRDTIKWFVTLTRGDSPGVAKPVIAISDESVVRGVLRSLGKHLGLSPAARERPAIVPLPKKPEVDSISTSDAIDLRIGSPPTLVDRKRP